MLGHADAGDRVEGAVLDLPVVLEPDLHLVRQTGLGDPLPGQRDLLGRDGHPDRRDAVVPGRVQQQRTPTAAHVQQPHPGPQAQLAADQVELGRLGVLQALGARLPVRARVDHRGPEHQAVEVVAHVVVVADRRPVTAPGVQPALGRAGLLGRWGRLRADRTGPQRRGEQPAPAGPHRVPQARSQVLEVRAFGEAGHGRQDVVQVRVGREVQVAGDVRPSEAELAGVPEQAAQRTAVAEHQDGRVRRARRAAVPGLYPQRERDPQQFFQRSDQLRCDPRHRAPPTSRTDPSPARPRTSRTAVPSEPTARTAEPVAAPGLGCNSLRGPLIPRPPRNRTTGQFPRPPVRSVSPPRRASARRHR